MGSLYHIDMDLDIPIIASIGFYLEAIRLQILTKLKFCQTYNKNIYMYKMTFE